MNGLPSQHQVARELGQLLRGGLGRSKYVRESDVQALSGLSRELVSDGPGEAWSLCIARVVIEAIHRIPEAQRRLAVADMFGVILDERSVAELVEDIASGDAVDKLEGHRGRYQQAGERFRSPTKKDGYSERYVKENLRGKWLEEVAELLLDRKSLTSSVSDLPSASWPPTREEWEAIEKADRSESESLNLIAFWSINLYYAGLSSLLVANLDKRLPKVGSWEAHYHEGSTTLWNDLCHRFFDIYRKWVAFVWYSLYDVSLLEQLLTDLSPMQILHLKHLYKAALGSGPAEFLNLNRDEFLDLIWSGASDSAYRDGWVPWYEAAFPELQSDRYKPYVEIDFPEPDPGARQGVTLILRNAYRLYLSAAGRIALEGPYLTMAREEAKKNLSHWYALPRDRPVAEGLFMDEVIRRDFEKLEAEINGQTANIWYN